MSIKSLTNLCSPLFVEVNTQEGRTVIAKCNKSMRKELKTFLSQFIIYFEVIFGSVMWEAFIDEYRMSMANFE